MIKFFQSSLFASSGSCLSDQFVSGGVMQLSRIQSAAFDITYGRENIEYLDSTAEQVLFDPALAQLQFSYLVSNGYNERLLGFFTNPTGNAFKKLNEYKNFYLVFDDQGVDLNGKSYSGTTRTIAFGNTFLNNWSLEASIDSFVTANATFSAYNVLSLTGNPSGQNIPAINARDGTLVSGQFTLPISESLFSDIYGNPADSISALSKGDIVLNFSSGSVFANNLSGANSCIIQNFNCSAGINWEPINNLGYKYPETRIKFPIEIDLSVEALVDSFKVDQLNKSTCLDSGHNFDIFIKKPCSDFVAYQLRFKNLKLESQSSSLDIGGYTTVSFNWKGYLYNFGTGQTNMSIYASQGSTFYELDSMVNVTGYDLNGDIFITQQSIYNRKIAENEF